MTARNYIFLVALPVLACFVIAGSFYFIYNGLKKKRILKKLGPRNTFTLFSLLFLIAVFSYGLLYFAAFQSIYLSLFLYIILIYLILDKCTKYILKMMGVSSTEYVRKATAAQRKSPKKKFRKGKR
jgi:uncharacterized membrane protein YfcA